MPLDIIGMRLLLYMMTLEILPIHLMDHINHAQLDVTFVVQQTHAFHAHKMHSLEVMVYVTTNVLKIIPTML